MKITHEKTLKNQAGFTLVELAIVMIIIGLLITGVLKGQEMVTNARVTSTIAQVKSIDAATSTFRDIHDAFPGDMDTASTRLPNCAGGAANPNCGDGNDDGRVSAGIGLIPGGATEALFFFTHMAAADLISGIDGQTRTFGSSFPSSPLGGGFLIGHTAPATPVLFDANELEQGHYLLLMRNLSLATGSGIATVSQAARIDRKLDDGRPHTGSVISEGGNCRNNVIYNELNQDVTCNLAIRIQG